MKVENLPPELLIHTIRLVSELKPGQWLWTTGKFDEMFSEPEKTEVVAIDARIYDNYHLYDPKCFLLGNPLPGGGVQNIGHFYYADWNIGPNIKPNNWYVCKTQEGAQEIYDYLVFMYLLFP